MLFRSIKDQIDRTGVSEDIELTQSSPQSDTTANFDMMETAKAESVKIKEGANAYADNVLANLQLMLTKLQKNLVRLEQNIESGRSVLETVKKDDETEKEDVTEVNEYFN